MIPIKLQLKNFLSYGPTLQTIDFGHYPLICLAGKNGHGKSALLDAITWAIWGQARKTSNTAKADKGLLRLGQTQMQVILEFECNNQHYRIRREFALSYGKSYAALDFGIFDQEKNCFIPLTDKTIRKTQKKIEETIHLDFESFTNSAFLRQGHANEFSQKLPKERKEILASILGLNEYEQIKKLASEKMRAQASERKAHCAIQEKRAQELAHKNNLEKDIINIDKELEQLKKQEKSAEDQIKKQHIKKEDLLECKKNYEIIQVKLKQIEEKETEHQELFRTVFNTWRNVHAQHLEQTSEYNITEKKELLEKKIKQHQTALEKNLQLKEQELKKKEELQKITQEIRQEYAQKIQKEHMELERFRIEKKSIQQQIKELLKNVDAAKEETKSCGQTIQTIKKLLAQHISDDKKQKEIKQFERRKEYYQRYIAQGNYTKQELDALEQKKRLVHNEESPSCPLCEQNLSAARRRFLKQKFATQQELLEHRFARLSNIIKSLKEALIEQHKQLETIKKETEKQNSYQAQYQEAQKEYKKLCETIEAIDKQIKQYQKNINGFQKKITDQEKIVTSLEKNEIKSIENNEAHKKIQQALIAIEKEVNKNCYNAQQHDRLKVELEKLEKLQKQHIVFLQELSKQPERKEQIHRLCTELKKIKNEKILLKNSQEKHKAGLEKENELKKEEALLVDTLKKLIQEKEILLQKKGSLENQKEKLAQIEKEFHTEEKTLKELQQSIDDYLVIATATGKDGIQALLIEDAIPEIEQEANKLLGKLTDNQSQIIIESLRDLKKGGTRETLDIKVADSMGIRPYELFSGGEAFRIDFALRIAISKLLARRAGTALQTLIIDEGFGSQDEEGLSRIMDAIYKIQDDFCKVIIVSHLSTMKDQFPIHFFVQKSASGSIVKVIEQG